MKKLVEVLIMSILFLLNGCNSKNSKDVLFNELFTNDKTKIKLPDPQKTIGKPLMHALNLRKSTKSYLTKQIRLQDLSNILWAGFGINRINGGRTAPSAWNWQEIDIYLLTAYGVYIYDAKEHSIIRILKDDIRDSTCATDYEKDAPISLVFIADLSKLKNTPTPDETVIRFTNADAAFISQNVYLYCASEGLGTLVYEGLHKEIFAEKINLEKHKRIIYAQCIGYSKNI